MIGKTLDRRYKIIRELGRGGFGETFVAIDIKRHGSLCVVKKLNPFSEDRGTLKLARILFELVKKLNPFSEDRETLKLTRILFERESKALLRLEHNQIPQLLAYFTQNNNFFLVQELRKKSLRND
jgi:serine/threonine protein kinase